MNAITAFKGLIACSMFGWCAPADASAALTVYALEWAPYSWKHTSSGKVGGIAVDIVDELMTRAGVRIDSIDTVPWARGLALTASTRDTCQVMVGRTPEREKKFKWIGPIGHSRWSIFGLRESKIKLRQLHDARPYLVGTIIHDLSIPILKAHKIRVSEVAADRLNPPKLLRGRIDLWASADLPASYLMRDLGLTNVDLLLTFATVPMFFACNNSMRDGEVARLNGIINTMIADKSIERIYHAYGFMSAAPATAVLERDHKIP
ncbi:transporter substrate-binding domain-containing protein [Massilia sp. DJPM01]|uniref:substrate-binding periplasmic protein n=1 Tax=Massilia sp. DJPM01 TaxID=3024404 RepID=UPI00259F7F0A|nr:transporter substrate-binding domain-containing protein [Massilia sp. DJPM01]MDM5180636.1 transporter substrate-binding domain-containing protein [Massilia sp. DJPM01]